MPAVSFGRAGFTLSPGTGSTARLVSGKAFWANVLQDTDFIATPLPTGVQALWQLRSTRSPTHLRLRAGGVDDVRVGAGGAARLMRDGRSVGTLTPPRAEDADGRMVAVTWRAHGSSLVLDVHHRRGGVRYPVLVDPYVADDQRYWAANAAMDFTGWEFTGDPTYVTGSKGPGAYGNGLNLAVLPRASGIPAGTAGRYDFKARAYPGDFAAEGAHIFKADFGYTAATVSGLSAACWQEGIIANTGGSAEPSGRYRGSQVTDAYTPYPLVAGTSVYLPFVSCSNEGTAGQILTYGYRVHCLSTCGIEGGNPQLGSPGNSATLRINPVIGGSLGAFVYMGASLVFQSESFGPHNQLTGLPPGGGWVDDVSLTARADDYGLGTAAVSATAPGTSWAGSTAPTPSCITSTPNPPQGGTPGSGNQGDRNHQCARTMTTSFRTGATNPLPEGSYDIRVRSVDIVQNLTDTNIPVKVDHAPPILSLTGALKDADGGFAKHGDSIHISATDAHSGARTLSVKLDDQPIAGSPASCGTDGCSTSLDYTLDTTSVTEGAHTLTVDASDLLGHAAATQRVTFRVDKTAPIVQPSGELWMDDESVLGDTGYPLHIEAVDGTAEWPGSGVKQLSVRIDDQQVASFPTASCPPVNCAAKADWIFDTSTVAAGVHKIDIVATDGAGKTATSGLSVDVQPQPGLPAAVTTPAAKASLRVDGANGSLLGLGGDRLGSAVAAIGDQNADGIDDFLVSSPDRGAGAGAVYVIYGGQSGTLDTGQLTAQRGYVITGGPLDRAGTALASAGDVNGDGVADFLIGAPGTQVLGSQLLPGKVAVVFGGRCQGFSLASMGSCGFTISGPLPLLLDIGSTVPGFGSVLGNVPAQLGASGADVNGDGLDDVAIGNARADNGNRTDSGSVYVIYGRTASGSVNALNSTTLGASGYRIDGAAAGNHSGASVAITGDISGDEVADIVVGSPGATSSDPVAPGAQRASSGAATVVYGKANNNYVDLSTLGAQGVPVLGATGMQAGNSVAALGDVDGDSIPDFAVAGRGAAVVLGRENDENEPIDLADPDEFAYRSTAPAGAGADAIVSALGDANADGLPDVALAYPSLGSAFTLFTQDDMRTLLRDNAAPTSLPGEQSTRYNPSAANDGTAASVAGRGQPERDATLIIGAPRAGNNSRPASGSAYIVSDAGPVVPASFVQAAATPAERKQCKGLIAPQAGYVYFRPGAPENSASFSWWNCRRTTAKNLEQTPKRPMCGSLGPTGCKKNLPTKVAAAIKRRTGNAFNARQRVTKPLIDNDFAAGRMEQVITPSSPPAAGAPVAQAGAAPGTEWAWPMKDSNGTLIGYIRQVPPRAQGANPAADPGVRPGTFRVWNPAKQFLGTTAPGRHDPFIQMEGQPCAAKTDALRNTTTLIYVRDANAAEDDDPLDIRALLPLKAFPEGAFTLTDSGPAIRLSNDAASRAYWVPCRKPPRSLPSAQLGLRTYNTPSFAFPSSATPYPDRYQSQNVVRDKAGPSLGGDTNRCPNNYVQTAHEPRCSAALANYIFPAPRTPSNEVQRVKINATAGQFSLVIRPLPTDPGPATTAPLSFDAPVGEVQARIGDSGYGQEIKVAGGPSDYRLTYVLNHAGKDVAEVVVDETPATPQQPGAPPLSGAPAGTPQAAVSTLVQGASAKPTYPPLTVLSPSTTGVNGGGITRGLLVTPSQVRVYDKFDYLDPNVPCGQAEIASWNLVRLDPDPANNIRNRGVYLWAPRRAGDGNTPALPAPDHPPHPC